MTDRRHLTTKQKLEVLVRFSRCPICGEKFGSLDEIDWDHEGQLALTEDNSLDNFRPLHREDCHARKTARDAADRAKTKRLAADAEEFRRRILAKGEQQPPAKPRWRKRMNGTVERR